MADKLTDDDIIEIGNAARQYMRYLGKLSPAETAKALGLPEGASYGEIMLRERAAVETLQQYFMLGQVLVEGKRAARDIMLNYVIGFAGGAAAGMSADKLNVLLQAYGTFRPDQIVEGFFSTKKGYAISCNSVGKCTVVTPKRLVLVKP